MLLAQAEVLSEVWSFGPSANAQRSIVRYRLGLLIFLCFIGHAAAASWAASPGDKGVYAPSRESLSRYQVPEWYHDAKIGFFYHWGPQSAVGHKWDEDASNFCYQKGPYKGSNSAKKNPVGQWGRHMYPIIRNGKILPDNEQEASYILYRRMFGDPKEFGYKDLIPLMSDDGFDPDEMVRLLDEAGVKYIVPQAIHHDGFAMWDSKVIDEFNAAKMGPKCNTTKEVIDAARRRGIKVGVSTHASRHHRYYPKLPGYDTSDPRYVQLYGRGSAKGRLPHPESVQKWEDTMGELVDLFQPDYIFVDGGSADIFSSTGSYVWQDAFRRVLANYYNKAQQGGWEPVLTFKRESL
jgi:alpha-L-fucosidase